MSQIKEIFEKIVSRFDAEKMSDFNATVQFDLTGDNAEPYYLTLAEGKANYGQGTAEKSDATITMDSEDFKAMTSGDLNPMMAFMQGKIKVDGDMNAVMKLQSLLGG